MKKILLVILPFVLSASSFHTEKVIKDNNSAVIKIYTHSIKPNYYLPWLSGEQESSTGSGVIIDNNLILTAAHVVSDATYLEVQKSTDPKKYFARVKWIAHDADLALLEVEDNDFFIHTKAIKLGSMPKRQDGVAVYGYPEGGSQISITQGVISRIEHSTYVHSKLDLLTIQIDAAINPGNSGGPAFNKKGEIVGIAMQGLLSSNSIGYIVPTPIIKHFLKDIEDTVYDGFPDDGTYIQSMENIDLKKHYAMEGRTGLLITQIIKNNSVDGYLRREDVILEIDGHTVADDGSVKTDGLERISANYLIRKHFVEETINIKILRQGKEKLITVPLKKMTSIIPFEHDLLPRYYIFGGMVFIPLTKNYLHAWGKDWKQDAPMNLLYQVSFIDFTDTRQKEVIFLKDLLPDKINSGYDAYHELIKEVNGVSIYSLDDLVKQIETAKKEVKILTSHGKIYILNKKRALNAEKRIFENYGIKKKSYLRN